MTTSMSHLRRAASVFLIFGILLVIEWTASTQAAGSFFPIEDVRPGQWGTARTVIQGTEIETFSVEVLGVLDNAGPSGDLIMVKVAGDVIERTGGLASGMSGSPVYIDGKLLGAIAYGYATDPSIALVTPIEQMLDLLRAMEAAETALRGGRDHGTAEGENSGNVVPITSPLLVSGLGDRALKRLTEGLRPYNLVPIRSAGVGQESANAPLEPGSAIAAQLVRGDINVSYVGTLTYIHDDQFLAFGHSLLNFGTVDYIAAQAYIHRTIGRIGSAMKLGAPLDAIGRVLQDRGAGVAGHLGEIPKTVKLTVRVVDHSLGRETAFEAEIINSEALLVELVSSAVLEAVDRGIDRIGPGWARVKVYMHGAGLPRPIERENVFYSTYDIAAELLGEFLWGLQEFTWNEFRAIDFEEIRIDVEVSEQRRTARLVAAVPERTVVHPGDVVPVEVTLRPYRGELQTEIVDLVIPADSNLGEVVVVVRPGMFPYLSAEDIVFEELTDEFYTSVDSLEQLIEAFVNEERNDEIVLEYYPPFAQAPADEPSFGEEGDSQDYMGYDWDEWPDPVVVSKRTAYVIEGGTSFTLEIVAAEPDEASDGPAGKDIRRSSLVRRD